MASGTGSGSPTTAPLALPAAAPRREPAKPATGNGAVTTARAEPPTIVGPTGVPKDEEGLTSVMILCENGKLSITYAHNMLLCLVADQDVEFGILKAKVEISISFV
ncbi:hypothetical protein HK405_012110 [Cladochytrium tenue]|nr:hypothetical protein HK405_012110 [Cladochytrium tenue]